MPKKNNPIADNESFIRLVQVARDDAEIKNVLLDILKAGSFNRISLLNTYIDKMTLQKAPQDFINALGYLREDDIAKQVLDIIQAE